MKSLLSKDEKTKLLETFRSFGQTQTAFAEVNGINPKTLARLIYQQWLEANPECSKCLMKFNGTLKLRRSSLAASGKMITQRKSIL